MADVPADRRCSPALSIAGPALEAMRYTANEEELQNLFANLLAASMDSDKSSMVHRAFVDIIRNISSDEAKIIKYLFDNKNQCASIDLKMEVRVEGGRPLFFTLDLFYSMIIIDSGCEVQGGSNIYIDNLIRLRLLEVLEGRTMTDESQYRKIKEHPNTEEYEIYAQSKGGKLRFRNGIIQLTGLGISFASICVCKKNR